MVVNAVITASNPDRVTPGIQMPDFIEITQGLSKGDRVVVSDRSGLKTDERITPKAAPVGCLRRKYSTLTRPLPNLCRPFRFVIRISSSSCAL